jgi:hypothetical protein
MADDSRPPHLTAFNQKGWIFSPFGAFRSGASAIPVRHVAYAKDQRKRFQELPGMHRFVSFLFDSSIHV